MDLEKVSANLDGMGASSRAGESIQVVFEHAGTDTIYASKAFCVLTYTQKLELRKLVRRTGGVKSVLPPSQQCAGDVACHGWPVLWRQSSRSAPRPWLRGCLQAAPRDPGSGVRCVYWSSYGYTRVYWSQLPAVGAFGRVWWPWRTMRTQKVAFLNYIGVHLDLDRGSQGQTQKPC